GAVSALRLGAADYILKPVNADELRARLGRIAERRRAERELQKHERILRSVLDNVRDAVIVVDEDGRVISFHPAAGGLLGPCRVGLGPDEWPQRRSAGRPDAAGGASPAELPLARALRGEEVADAELFLPSPDRPGGVWVSANASPLRDASGAPRGAVGILR